MRSFLLVDLQQQWLPLMLVAILVPKPPTRHRDKSYEHNTNDETSDYQGHIDRNWVSIEATMGK